MSLQHMRNWLGSLNSREILLGILALAAGFVMMVYELAAARMLAPYVGSSTYVWTSVIGVIVAALSIGYWIGGRLADRRNYFADIASLYIIVGILIAYSLVFFRGVTVTTLTWDMDVRFQAVFLTCILYAPASVVIGMISPYLAKLNVTSLASSGRSIANLSMCNAIGSISGTFLTGFYLFNYIGVRELVTYLALGCVLLSWCIAPTYHWRIRFAGAMAILGILLISASPRVVAAREVDTAAAHYIVGTQEYDGRPLRTLVMSPRGVQSGVFLDAPDELAFWYTQQMARAAEEVKPDAKSILLLGGGAYTLPRYLAQKMPETEIDVVEIDPGLVDLARSDFFYSDPENVNVIAEDARAFLARNTKQYDIVMADAFSGESIPVTLVTAEYGEAIKRATADRGIVVVNMIAGNEGACKKLSDAVSAPYRANFKHGYYVLQDSSQDRTNIMGVFSDMPAKPVGYTPYATLGTSVLTDNYAPIERMSQDCSR